jgi:hypothetical protein
VNEGLSAVVFTVTTDTKVHSVFTKRYAFCFIRLFLVLMNDATVLTRTDRPTVFKPSAAFRISTWPQNAKGILLLTQADRMCNTCVQYKRLRFAVCRVMTPCNQCFGCTYRLHLHHPLFTFNCLRGSGSSLSCRQFQSK